ncbi:MAG TPA: pentapeptide repeat-containing protein [Streptosporangiaceae bacterium]|nr:pentapeptide repeat-containing protein [Streptosporangiaceae bacterium]
MIIETLGDLPYADVLRAYDGPWRPDETYDAIHVDGGTVAAPDAAHARFLECAFTQVTFDGGTARRARLSDVWLREVRMIAVDLAETEWLDATLLDCVLAGTEAYGADLRRVVFRGGKLDSVNFRDATLTDVRFENCVLRDVDLGGATLERVRFPGCRLSEVELTGVTLTKVDLRGAELDIVGGHESLRGATISTAQLIDLAPALARSLGITVRDG